MLGEPLSIGIEEEYILVNLETRDSRQIRRKLPACLRRAAWRAGDAGIPALSDRGWNEGLPHRCRSADGVRFLRRTLSSDAQRHGMGLMVASTHPFADRRDCQNKEHSTPSWIIS